MDVNVVFARLREIAAEEAERTGGVDAHVLIERFGEMVERFQDLDEWLSRGGFLPTPWAR